MTIKDTDGVQYAVAFFRDIARRDAVAFFRAHGIGFEANEDTAIFTGPDGSKYTLYARGTGSITLDQMGDRVDPEFQAELCLRRNA